MNINIDQRFLNPQILNSQVIPTEGPKAIPLVLSFTTGAENYIVDLTQMQQRGMFSMLQTIFVDFSAIPSSANFGALLITMGEGGNNQVLDIGYQSCVQGYFNVLCPNPIKLQVSMLVTASEEFSGPVSATIFLINTPIPGVVWSSEAA
jgi:hypothetical protein